LHILSNQAKSPAAHTYQYFRPFQIYVIRKPDTAANSFDRALNRSYARDRSLSSDVSKLTYRLGEARILPDDTIEPAEPG
jgi:hypothetical protein